MAMDLSTNDARVALAKKWAVKYGLDPFLVCALIEQESGWNPWAMRYEPGFLQRYIANMKLEPTEAAARATSFGLCQVMGQTAREKGFQGKFLTQLCDPDVGVELGCRKLQECFAVHGDPETSLLAYNGGGSPEYGKEVLARVAHYMPQEGAEP
ncbi:MAG TPA: transglycosylase SLT domain-containing protein [Candidatus Acidoferrum sp.]|nr:transglycosylase SLT domain-containing protein [Candidatus Acidoferrum sp.]